MISNTWKNYKNLSTETWSTIESVFIKTKVRNHGNVSVSFSARNSKIELKIAMKTWDTLKATYLITLLHISVTLLHISVKTERSRLISILLTYGIFSKNYNYITAQVEIIYCALPVLRDRGAPPPPPLLISKLLRT